MWLEKLCKAYLWWGAAPGTDLSEFKKKHKVVAKALPALVQNYWRNARVPTRRDVLSHVRELCREIDLLHPRPEGDEPPRNVEYPWPEFRDGRPVVVAPVDEAFRPDDRLKKHVGLDLMKAAKVLTRQPALWAGDSSL